VPWKQCPACKGWSYSAATNYDTWSCPYCEQDLTDEPEVDQPPEDVRKPEA